MKMASVVGATRRWVSDVVIGLVLCPWAQPARDRGGIRYAVTAAPTPEALLAEVAAEMHLMQELPEIETTLLIHPYALRAWDDFYPWIVLDAEGWLEREGLDEDFQIVGFHPGFCFGGEEADDPSHWTNRSPYPMTHILRQASVEAQQYRQ